MNVMFTYIIIMRTLNTLLGLGIVSFSSVGVQPVIALVTNAPVLTRTQLLHSQTQHYDTSERWTGLGTMIFSDGSRIFLTFPRILHA